MKISGPLIICLPLMWAAGCPVSRRIIAGPCRVIGVPCRVLGVPCRVIGVPCRILGVPCRVIGVRCRAIGGPCRVLVCRGRIREPETVTAYRTSCVSGRLS